MPQLEEVYRRAGDIDKRVRSGDLYLEGLGLYLLNAEAIRVRQHKFLKRGPQLEILTRLRDTYPLVEPDKIPGPNVQSLPQRLQGMIMDCDTWRAEWFYNGLNVCLTSDAWTKAFHYPKKRYTVKIMETAGFCRWESMMKLWSDSLFYMDRVIFYEGKATRKDKDGAVIQKARMLTHVLDHDHVITVTTITIQSEL